MQCVKKLNDYPKFGKDPLGFVVKLDAVGYTSIITGFEVVPSSCWLRNFALPRQSNHARVMLLNEDPKDTVHVPVLLTLDISNFLPTAA
jgi:hypothetical protein